MKNLLKLLLLPALCAFCLLQAQQVAAQSKDNDVLVLEYGYLMHMNAKTHGLYIFWPDKDSEFIPIEVADKATEILAIKRTIYQKINELADLGWELEIVDNSMGTSTGRALSTSLGSITYYFKRTTPK